MAARRPFLRRGPSGPLADKSGLIQVGYDQVIEFLLIPAGSFAKIPRDVAGNPVKVILPDVVPGNLLEVDWSATLAAALDVSYPLVFSFFGVALVSFDGSEPTSPSLTSFFVLDSYAGSRFDDPDAATTDVQSMRGLAGVVIPDGAVTATVELLYGSDGEAACGPAELALTLKVSEIGIDSVSQVGPGTLAPAT